MARSQSISYRSPQIATIQMALTKTMACSSTGTNPAAGAVNIQCVVELGTVIGAARMDCALMPITTMSGGGAAQTQRGRVRHASNYALME